MRQSTTLADSSTARQHVSLFLGFALILLMLAAALPARASASAGGWFAQNSGTTSTLWSVDFADSSHGWAVGDDGTIRVTADGGVNWGTQNSGETCYLDSVSFPDAMHGWAVGSAGTIVATTNGGSSWFVQYSGTFENLNAVCFVSASRGWAVGDNATILETIDAGATWHPETAGDTTEAFNAVAFSPDVTVGLLVGDAGAIHGYGAGAGASQTATASRFRSMLGSGATAAFGSADLNGIALPDAAHGWGVGNSGTIFVIHDPGSSGGQSYWQTSGTSANLNGVAFTDASHGWVVGDGWFNWSGTVLGTTDGGTTWVTQSAAITAPLYGVAFADSTHGWAVGQGGTIFATTTGGIPAPTVSSFAPGSGPVGTTMALTGTDFTGATRIAFNGTSAATFSVVSATQATAVVPAGATTGTISITTPGGTATSATSFTVTVAPAPAPSKPSITKLSPTAGKRGATVTITGKNFGARRGPSLVKFGTKACTKYVSWSATRIKVKVPAIATFGSLKVTVKTTGGTSNAKSFRVRR